MAAASIDLIISKGATFRKRFTYQDNTRTPIPLTDFTARMQIRESHSDADFIAELTTGNGGIVITPAAGQLDLFLSDTVTSAITEMGGVYDLELIDSGDTDDVTKLVRGTVTFISEVTK